MLEEFFYVKHYVNVRVRAHVSGSLKKSKHITLSSFFRTASPKGIVP